MSKEEYIKLVDQWDSCQYYISQGRGALSTKAKQRQAQIEHDMEGAPWEFDGDGNVVEKIEEVIAKRISGAEPSNMLQCENCKQIKPTTLEEIWSKAYPEGYLRRICTNCGMCYGAE